MKQLIIGFTKLTAASVLIASLVACGGADDRKVKYLEKGKAYLADKNYEKARIEIKNVLQIDPKYAEAYFYMGQLSEESKDFNKALGNYRKAIELNPEYTLAKIKLAKIYAVAGTEDFIKEANKLLIEVTKENPGNSEAALISATIKYKTGNKKEAVSELEAIVKSDGTLVEGISLLSTIYIMNGDESRAIDLLSKGVEVNTNNVPLRIVLAKILAKNNDYSNAEKYLKQAIDIDPEKYSLKLALASFYASSNNIDKAESVLRSAIEQNDQDAQRYLMLVEMLMSKVSVQKAEEELAMAIKNKPDLYDLKFAQIKIYKQLGKLEAAKSALKQIIADKSLDNEGVYARNQLAEYLFDEGDYKAAKSYVDEIITEYPNNNDALLLSGKLAILNLDPIKAINGLRTVVKNEPKNAEASLLLAQAHELNNEPALAENELKKAIENNPVNAQTHVNYARYLGSVGRIDEAVKVVDKALLYFKDNYDLMDLKLRIIASQGKDTEVFALLNMMEQSEPDKAEVNIHKGQYFQSKREFIKALAEFEKAYEKSVDKYEPLKLIVNAYLIDNKVDKALARLQKNIDINPNDAISNLLMGQIYQGQKKVKEARAKFILSSSAAETWFLPYSSLASSYLAEKNFDQAIKIYQDASTKLKDATPAKLQIAAIYESQSKFKNAMTIYESVLVDKPNNKLAINNYSSLLLDYGNKEDATKALEMVKNFENLSQPAFQDTLGWAYAKSGDYVKAVEILSPVVEKSSKVAVFRYHLGFSLYNMGDKEAAKSHLQIAVSSEQSFAGKDEAAKLLKSL